MSIIIGGSICYILIRELYFENVKAHSKFVYTATKILKRESLVGQGTIINYRYFYKNKSYDGFVSNEKEYSDLKFGDYVLTRLYLENIEVIELLPNHILNLGFSESEIPENGWESIPYDYLREQSLR
jgi:hypothetical protein